jgi:hypothetical protein
VLAGERSAPAWTPTGVAGLALWIDASGPVYTNTAGTLAASVGQAVAYVPDKSGLARHVTQTTATLRPTLALYAGKRALLFDTDDVIVSPSYAAGPGLTIVAVARRDWTSAGGIYRTLFVHSNVDTATSSGGGIFAVAGGAFSDWQNNELLGLGNGSTAGRAPRVAGPLTGASTNIAVLGIHLGASGSAVNVNGTATTRLSADGALPTAGTSYAARIGYGVTAYPFAGHIMEMMVWTNGISTANFNAAIEYAKNKWGVE